MPSVAMKLLAFMAVVATATRGKNGDEDQLKGVMALVQGTMMMAQSLEKINGPPPPKKYDDMMDQASPLIYDSYSMFTAASERAAGVLEQLKAGSHVGATASDLASVESLMQEGSAKLTQGQKLAREAVSGLMNSADPLAEQQPQEPKVWTQIESSARRSSEKMTYLRGRISEAKSLARQRGVSLVAVKSVAADTYSKSRDDALLDFLENDENSA